MFIKHFKAVKNHQELKSEYKRLAKQYHPDLNKDKDTTATMQEINAEYDYMVNHLKETNKDDKYAKYHTVNDGYKEIINAIIHFDLDIEICGTWIWIGQRNSKDHKDELKAAGFMWAGAKKMWYWKPADYVKTAKKTYSMDEIRNYYGSQKVQAGQKKEEEEKKRIKK